jgi:hypothetical protein
MDKSNYCMNENVLFRDKKRSAFINFTVNPASKSFTFLNNSDLLGLQWYVVVIMHAWLSLLMPASAEVAGGCGHGGQEVGC